jgi:hypothetical protein
MTVGQETLDNEPYRLTAAMRSGASAYRRDRSPERRARQRRVRAPLLAAMLASDPFRTVDRKHDLVCEYMSINCILCTDSG